MLVERAGDVIPKVVKVIIEKRPQNTEKYHISNVCPICEHTAFRSEDKAVMRCQNLSCPAQIKGRIEHFVSRNALDIDGFGEKLVNQLVDKNILSSVDQIFKLKYDDLANLERMAEKSANNILSSIAESENTTFARFVYGLGIRNVGGHIAKVLEKHFTADIHLFINSTREELDDIFEIGPIVSEGIVQFWDDDANRNVVISCINNGVKFAAQETSPMVQKFAGKIFVLTGGMESLTRTKTKEIIEKFGGRANGTVSTKTDYLIAGTGAGSKLNKAQELGVKILSEKEFLEMIQK